MAPITKTVEQRHWEGGGGVSEGGHQRAPILTFHGNTGSKIANAGNTCTSTLKEYYPKWLKQSQLTVSGTKRQDRSSCFLS